MEDETNGACMALWGAEPAAASLLGSIALSSVVAAHIINTSFMFASSALKSRQEGADLE